MALAIERLRHRFAVGRNVEDRRNAIVGDGGQTLHAPTRDQALRQNTVIQLVRRKDAQSLVEMLFEF